MNGAIAPSPVEADGEAKTAMGTDAMGALEIDTACASSSASLSRIRAARGPDQAGHCASREIPNVDDATVAAFPTVAHDARTGLAAASAARPALGR